MTLENARRFSLAFVFFFPFSAAALLSHYGVQVWQREDGLPQNYVQSILQTHDQYIWVGTQKGLARFDGVRFTVFTPENTPALEGRSITTLCESGDGTLWIGTSDGGLTSLQGGVFSHFGKAEGLRSNYVKIIRETKNGVLWIGTREGLFKFSRGIFSNVQTNLLAARATIRALDEDTDGTLWIGTDRGLVQWNNGNVALLSAQTNEGMLNNEVRALCRDDQGNLWIGSDDGLTRLRQGTFTNYGKNGKWVNTVFQDSTSNLWVGSYSGLSRLSHGKLIPELNNEGMSFDSVNAIMEDKEGNIWLGCKDGLSRLRIRPFRAYTAKEGLTHNNTMSVVEDASGSMWIGTWGGGLNELKDGRFVSHTGKDTLESQLILALQQEDAGGLWIGTDFDGGLFHLQNGGFTRYAKEQGLIDSAVKVICEDRQKNLWVGTRSALNLFKDGKFTRYTTNEGLAGNMINAILQDHAGHMWFGTDGGLSKWDAGKFSTFTTRQGLSANRITAIHEDAEGVLWLGTKGGGLNCFRNNKFHSYTSKQGLFSDDIFEILETDRGYFWMTCQNGIFRCPKKDFADFDSKKINTITSISYGKADGLVSTVCNSVAKPAAWKARDGRLWFATTKGVVVADPDSNTKINRTPPPVFIEQIIADKKKMNVPAGQRASGDSSSIRPLAIPAGRGELEFHYTALSFQAPEKNRFKYKLHGVDTDWVEAGARREAYYNNIHPGSYKFQVIACNNDGFWNATGTSFAFTMLPHFWETWWFKLFFLTSLGLLSALAYRIRTGRTRDLERLRLRIAADLHDEVGSNLGSISLLSLMMQQNESTPAESKKDLALIHRISGQTANSIKDIVWFTNPEYDTLQDLLLRMKDVANTLPPGMHCDFQSNVENPTRKLSLDFRQNIFLMYKEILANVLKHSGAQRVEISISETGKIWNLNINDNGTGFDSTRLSQGNGLKNLRRRAATLKGALKIEPQIGRGTKIFFSTKNY